jgi:hypothetical protein
MWTWLKGRLAVAARENEARCRWSAAAQHQSRPRPSPAGHRGLSHRLLGQRAQLPAAQPQAQRGAARAGRAADRRGARRAVLCRPTRAPRCAISARACITCCCATASWSSPTCRATCCRSPTRRAGRSDAHLLLRRPQQLRGARPAPCCRAGRRSSSWCSRGRLQRRRLLRAPANRVVELGSRIEI